MKKILAALVFFMLPLSLYAEPTFERALFIGDSHSYGKFGEKIDTYLRSVAGQVDTVASCGSSPSTWLAKGDNYKSTNCGYWSKDSPGHDIRTKSHKIESFSEKMASVKPDLTVVALGTNILASPGNIAQEKKSIEAMLAEIKAAHSKCVWVGPPDVAKNPFKQNLAEGVKEMRELVEKNGCMYIDSTKMTSYPSSNKDGIHYGPQDAAAWGEKVTKAIDGYRSIYANRRGVSAPAAAEAPAGASSGGAQ